MGDLRSRSYSSANPNYFVFCAFQCYHNTTKEQLKLIEECALKYLDKVFCSDNGLTNRARHFESQCLSECYYNINFEDFFMCLHDYLMHHQVRFFMTDQYDNHSASIYGAALSCEFNPRLTDEQKSHFLRLIVR